MSLPRNKYRCQECGKPVVSEGFFCSRLCGMIFATNSLMGDWDTPCPTCGCHRVDGFECPWCFHNRRARRAFSRRWR